MTQISEKVIKDSLADLNDIWFMKIQNIHTTKTPADFIALGKFRYLIEVKEVSVYKGYKIYNFDRLTQKDALRRFGYFNKLNKSYILINFRAKTLKKSSLFLIPLVEYMMFEIRMMKKSGNLNDFETAFSGHKLNVLPGSVVDLSHIII